MDKTVLLLNLARMKAYVTLAETSLKDGTATPDSLSRYFTNIEDQAQKCFAECAPDTGR